MLLLIKRNTAICKLASLEGYKKKRKMNEFKEKKNGEGRFLRLPRLSYRDETIRVTFAISAISGRCQQHQSRVIG